MLHEHGVTAGGSHVRLQDVLSRAGSTIGAACRLWSDQKDDGDGATAEESTLFGVLANALVEAFTLVCCKDV